MNTTRIQFTRVSNDTSGNPRYVCHFLNLLNEKEKENGYFDEKTQKYIEPILSISQKYAAALKRAKQIGGRKFHNKQYNRGILFKSYNIQDTEKEIFEILNK